MVFWSYQIWQSLTDFYHPGDEGGLAWNDPKIGKWPKLEGSYNGTASSEGYTMDGTSLNISEKTRNGWIHLSFERRFPCRTAKCNTYFW